MPNGSKNPQGTIQYVNNPLQSPQLPGPSSQPSSMSSQANKENRGGGDQMMQPLLSRQRLQELVKEVDPNLQLDDDIEDIIINMADDFIDSTLTAAIAFAKHRHAPTVELKDVQLHLERYWNMWIPGFGNDEVQPYKRAAVTEAHKQRMMLIKKTIKKH